MKNENTSLIPKEAQDNLKKMGAPTNYVPSIKITYAISPHFSEGKAKLGDFYFNDQSLSNEIKITALTYRYQAIALDSDSKRFIESLILGESAVPFRETEEYQKFIVKHKDDEVQDGFDILVYLPEYKMFGVIFCKKKLIKGGLQILELAGNGNVVSVKTIPKKWESLAWYELEVKPTNQKVATPDSEKVEEIYKNQIIGADEAEVEEDTSKRKR